MQPALLERVRVIVESAHSAVARSVNTSQVIAYWMIGKEIVEEEQGGKRRATYGEKLLLNIAEQLCTDYGKGWSYQNLKLMRQFYLAYPEIIPPNQIGYAVSGQFAPPKKGNASRSHSARLPMPIFNTEPSPSWHPGSLHPNLSWTHYRALLKVSRHEARNFYEIEAIENNWSARELERQIASLLFERLAKSRNKKATMRLATQGHEISRPIDIFKDPIVMEFAGIPESPRLVESGLEQALTDNLQKFLLELGKGFAFVARQQRVTLDGDHFYIDLVFYHTILKCYVLIDLKVGKLTHNDLGQMQFYVNYYDRERRTKGDKPTIGLILCPDKNDAVVKYTLAPDQKIFASRYQMYLPTEAELQVELQREMRFLNPLQPATNKVKKKPKLATESVNRKSK